MHGWRLAEQSHQQEREERRKKNSFLHQEQKALVPLEIAEVHGSGYGHEIQA